MVVWIGALGRRTRVRGTSGTVIGCAVLKGVWDMEDVNLIEIRNGGLCEARRVGYEDRVREVPVLVESVD